MALNCVGTMRHSLAVFVMVFCVRTFNTSGLLLCAQTSGKNAVPSSSVTALAKPIDFGIYSARMFSDDSRKVNFHLVTSWIPGESHKGMLRYKLSGLPTLPDSPDMRTQEEFIKRVADCAIFLNLDDKSGFVLRKELVTFGLGVDNDARISSLYANDSMQMDAQEYRELIGDSTASGFWNVSWKCAAQ